MGNNVNIKKFDERAIIPTYGTEHAAGCDLYAILDEKIEIKPHETVLISTGIGMEIPAGFGGFIYARSGIATKRGLAPANKVGVIDADYRGEIKVALCNHTDVVQEVEPMERIAQLVIAPYLKVEFIEVEELDETDRSSGGFGSTGTK